MAITSLDALIAAAQKGPTRVVSVAAAHERSVLEATVTARKKGIATPIYVGDSQKVTEILRELGEDPAEYRMVEGGSDEDCAQKATELVARGEADFLMKGYLGTATLLRAVLKREGGLVTGKLMSHMMLFETPLYPKLLLMTDGGMIPDPDLQQKIGILTHAAELLKKLEYDKIYAACLTGAEVINPKIPSTVHADVMSKMDWRAYQMEVYGPVALDLAVSPFSCQRKGYHAAGAGEADI
jgi:phosphate butyryltransferase